MRLRQSATRWLLVLFLVSGTALQAQGDKKKTGSTQPSSGITVPFETNALEILVPVRINGSKPLWFSLDSGASSMILDPARARELGLPLAESLPGSGAGAGVVMYTKIAQPLNIEVGGAKSAGHAFITIDLSGVSTNIGHRMDGILGYEFFMKYVVTVNYQKQTMTVVPPDSFQPSGAGTVLPMEIFKKVPFIRGELKVPGVPAQESRFMVDSGSADAVDHPLIKQSKGKVIDTTTGVGLGTPVPGFVGRGEYFKLGPYRMEGPITSCCGSNEINERMIGAEILRRFEVTFDYPHQRFILKPNRALTSAFAYDCAGLDFEVSEGGKAFSIRMVTPASPAAEAGIHTGDRIVAIDGQAADRFSLVRLAEMFMKPGNTHTLTLQREQATFKVKLKLRTIL